MICFERYEFVTSVSTSVHIVIIYWIFATQTISYVSAYNCVLNKHLTLEIGYLIQNSPTLTNSNQIAISKARKNDSNILVFQRSVIYQILPDLVDINCNFLNFCKYEKVKIKTNRGN